MQVIASLELVLAQRVWRAFWRDLLIWVRGNLWGGYVQVMDGAIGPALL